MNKNDEKTNSDSPVNGTEASSEKASDGSQATDAGALQLAQEETQKWKNEYLYLRAEFDNYKKHAIKDRADSLKFGAERVMRDLLEVIDNLDRALAVQVQADSIQQYVQGVEMTTKSLKEVLSKHGLQELPSDGQPFDPNIHEALSSEETSAVPAGSISKTFKKAYKLHDKVIRPAQVIVAKALTQN